MAAPSAWQIPKCPVRRRLPQTGRSRALGYPIHILNRRCLNRRCHATFLRSPICNLRSRPPSTRESVRAGWCSRAGYARFSIDLLHFLARDALSRRRDSRHCWWRGLRHLPGHGVRAASDADLGVASLPGNLRATRDDSHDGYPVVGSGCSLQTQRLRPARLMAHVTPSYARLRQTPGSQSDFGRVGKDEICAATPVFKGEQGGWGLVFRDRATSQARNHSMRSLPATIALSVVLIGSALAQTPSSPGQTNQGASGNNQTEQKQSNPAPRQKIMKNLQDSGFTDIRIMPESFLVRAKDKDGNPVMMLINPNSITAVTDVQGGGKTGETTGSGTRSNAGQSQDPGTSGR